MSTPRAQPRRTANRLQDQRLSVLVVEDNPIEREVLCAAIERTLPEARLQVVDNGFEALVRIGEHVPDILLTDLVMPHMDGFEMLRFVTDIPGIRPAAIVAISAKTADQIAAAGGLPEGVALLAKPIDPESLGAALRQAQAALQG